MYSITSPTILDVKYYEQEAFSLAAITYHSFSKTDDFQMCLITIWMSWLGIMKIVQHMRGTYQIGDAVLASPLEAIIALKFVLMYLHLGLFHKLQMCIQTNVFKSWILQLWCT